MTNLYMGEWYGYLTITWISGYNLFNYVYLTGIQLFSASKSEKNKLPEKIFVALNCLLEDEHPKVQLAAAISLHALQRPNERAEEVLRYNLLPEQVNKHLNTDFSAQTLTLKLFLKRCGYLE